MSKHTLDKEIQRELARINDRIDRKIIRGLPFRDEARRHKELLVTLQRISEDEVPVARTLRRSLRSVKSPVRTSLAGGAVRRLFGLSMA